MQLFLMGAIVMGYSIAGLFFLRFWTRTHDRLFAILSAAFWMLGFARAAIAYSGDISGHGHYLYWIRLVAYLLIIAAILDKNRRPTSQPPAEREVLVER